MYIITLIFCLNLNCPSTWHPNQKFTVDDSQTLLTEYHQNITLRQFVDAPLAKPAQDLSDSSQAPPLYRHFGWVCETHPPVIYAFSLLDALFEITHNSMQRSHSSEIS